MLRLGRALVVAFSSLALPLAAQADPAAAFLAEAAKKLDDYAKDCLEAGYPHRAEEVWRELLLLYDQDHAGARKALGYTQVGTSWAPDPAFVYPDAGTPSLAKAKALRTRWDRLAQELGHGHLKVAEAYAAAGQTEKATEHYDRVLRFQPGEPKAAAARGVANVDGFFGTNLEVDLLQRARLVKRAVTEVLAMKIKVEPEKAPHPILERAGITAIAFKGPHVTCYGNLEADVLQEAVCMAERALQLCKLVFDGFVTYPGGRVIGHLGFVRDEGDYVKVIEANRDMLGSGFEFTMKHKPAIIIRRDPDALSLMIGRSPPTVYDMSARWLAQTYSGFATDALNEGIGHTIVGLLTGRNLAFSIGEEKKEGTRASRTRELKLQIPDIAVWQELAVDTAWENTSVPAAQLPFLQAASFPTEGRIKAWSFCHYLLLRDPELMRKLDRMPGKDARSPYELRDKFTAVANVHVDALDHEWRDFWTKDTPLLREVRGGETTPLEAISQEAPQWLDAFNGVRRGFKQIVADLKLADVTWSEAYSDDCKLHLDYLDQNKSERGPGREDTEVLGKEGASARGKAFAEGAIVHYGAGKPEKIAETWVHLPGYRHVLLDPRLGVVGCFANRSGVVIDVRRGVGATQATSAYPFGNQKEVPPDVDVAALGPRVAELFSKHGKKAGKKIGYPLTVHFYGPGTIPATEGHYVCSLRQGKDTVEGIVDIALTGPARTSGPGLVVFYPLAPLKRGSEHTVEWTIGGQKEIGYKFITK